MNFVIAFLIAAAVGLTGIGAGSFAPIFCFFAKDKRAYIASKRFLFPKTERSGFSADKGWASPNRPGDGALGTLTAILEASAFPTDANS